MCVTVVCHTHMKCKHNNKAYKPSTGYWFLASHMINHPTITLLIILTNQNNKYLPTYMYLDYFMVLHICTDTVLVNCFSLSIW